ncbi:hypothetical protein T08_9666 [Trichinella sp. T8]|nr:hypothetical protein T08_9666 [Trichinella sp. T8]
MDIPKRNFSGWQPLSLEVLEQGFHLTRPKPVDLPKHSLAKVEESTLNPGVGEVALKSRDQGYFEIANKLRQINFDAKFFRFGMEHLNIQLYKGRSFLTVKQYTTGSSLRLRKRKQLVLPAADNLMRPIPAPAVTLSQQPHTILVGKN